MMRTEDKIRFCDRVIIRFMTPELDVGSQVLSSFFPLCPQPWNMQEVRKLRGLFTYKTSMCSASSLILSLFKAH